MTEPHDGPSDGQRQDPPEVGSVGDEAAKLLGALSEWARDSGADLTGGPDGGLGAGLGQTLSGLAGQAATVTAAVAATVTATVTEISAHVDSGAPECTYCPICRTVHVIRTTSPEVKAHLASAASSLLQAVAGALATLPPPPAGAGSEGATGSDHGRIDLDEDDELDGDGDDQ